VLLRNLLPFCVIAVFVFLIPTATFGQELVLINAPLSEKDHRSEYPRKLLQIALTKTQPTHGKFIIEYAPVMNWKRAKIMLEGGSSIHIIQAATSEDWERDLIPIRIPIMKGILGNRIFLIKKQAQAKFSAINSLREIKQLSAGLEPNWSISSIFKQTGFKVELGNSYEGLFGMLVSGRFDYFPRGINEAFDEYAYRKDKYPDLHIEETLLLNLPLPVYFFVTPKKPDLAERIELGLNMMIKDGSFDQLFYRFHKAMLEQIDVSNRKVFHTVNPNLTIETPFGRKELWLDLKTYRKQ